MEEVNHALYDQLFFLYFLVNLDISNMQLGNINFSKLIEIHLRDLIK